MSIVLQYVLSLVTGLVVGAVFSLVRLPIPAPPNIPAVVGILGITVGYMLCKHFLIT